MARRIVLAQEARLFGLEGAAAVAPADTDIEFDAHDERDMDELARYRRQHHRNGQSS